MKISILEHTRYQINPQQHVDVLCFSQALAYAEQKNYEKALELCKRAYV